MAGGLSHLGPYCCRQVADEEPRGANGTQDLFNLIMHKKVTFRGLLAWVVITPPAMLIGSYIVLAQKLDKMLGRSGVREITGGT